MTTDADLYEQLLNGNDQAVFAFAAESYRRIWA